jgi:hypothetical protein
MPRLDEDAVKALEAKHGDHLLVIHITEGADVTLVFKAATTAHWRRLNAADKRVVAGDDASALVPELIARELLVHPSKAEFDAIRDEAPWLADHAGRALVGRVGQKFKASVGES